MPNRTNLPVGYVAEIARAVYEAYGDELPDGAVYGTLNNPQRMPQGFLPHHAVRMGAVAYTEQFGIQKARDILSLGRPHRILAAAGTQLAFSIIGEPFGVSLIAQAGRFTDASLAAHPDDPTRWVFEPHSTYTGRALDLDVYMTTDPSNLDALSGVHQAYYADTIREVQSYRLRHVRIIQSAAMEAPVYHDAILNVTHIRASLS